MFNFTFSKFGYGPYEHECAKHRESVFKWQRQHKTKETDKKKPLWETVKYISKKIKQVVHERPLSTLFIIQRFFVAYYCLSFWLRIFLSIKYLFLIFCFVRRWSSLPLSFSFTIFMFSLIHEHQIWKFTINCWQHRYHNVSWHTAMCHKLKWLFTWLQSPDF